jgi:hypothetical protein
MWPKRKKGKARATKVKLKALQPPEEQLDGGSQEEPAPEVSPEPPSPRSKEEEMISGVWKSKVLSNYKQNPKDSHNLLARIPSGKAAFQAGERQKTEVIKESMIRVVDRMFDNFQNTAYEFNQVTGGSDLELSWIRPTLMVEDLSSWHESNKGTLEVFAGRISTRYWTLAVRGTVAGIGTYILPSDKLLGFSTSPSSFPCYLSIIPETDGIAVEWQIAKKAIEQDLFPGVYRALLDGLIRFASEEALPGEAFRLEDIGFLPEAPEAPSGPPVGYQEASSHDLLGQSSAGNKIVRDPRISPVHEPRADRFIDDLITDVAQAAQNETDKFRESMHAPPFGTTQGHYAPRPDAIPQSGGFRVENRQQADSGAYKQLDSGAYKQLDSGTSNQMDSGAYRQGSVSSTQGFESQDEGEWKTVSGSKTGGTNWRQFMESTKEHVQASNAKADDKWNAVPGTEQLARPEVPRASVENMMNSLPQSYPSYGNAEDPPVLLKPEDVGAPPPSSAQSGAYPAPQISQSGAYSAQQPAVGQSGVYSAQQPAVGQSGVYSAPQAPITQSGAFSAPQSPVSQSGAFSAQQQQIAQSGVFPAPPSPPQMMPPQMMPPGYGAQQPPMMPPPGMISPPPGMPGFPGMTPPNVNQSGAHPQPPMMPPGAYPGMPMPPQGMMPPQAMLPPGMPPHMVPGHHGDVSGQFQNQFNTGGQPQLPPQPSQYNTGGQKALPSQYSSGSQQAQAMPPQFQQPGPFQSAPHQPPQFPPPGQFQSGPYPSVIGPPPSDPRAFQSADTVSDDHAQYLLSESDFQEQSEQYEGTQVEEEVHEHELEPEQEGEAEADSQENWDGEQAEGVEELESEEDEESEAVVEEVEAEEVVESAEGSWEESNVAEFSMVSSMEATLPGSAEVSSFPQESFNELPVMSKETVQRFEEASKAGFVFSSENDFVDAISVVLSTIDSQIELLAQEGTKAFSSRDFRRAESIIRLSERLTTFKTEAQAIMQVLSEENK